MIMLPTGTSTAMFDWSVPLASIKATTTPAPARMAQNDSRDRIGNALQAPRSGEGSGDDHEQKDERADEHAATQQQCQHHADKHHLRQPAHDRDRCFALDVHGEPAAHQDHRNAEQDRAAGLKSRSLRRW